jgi:hypothetical protein
LRCWSGWPIFVRGCCSTEMVRPLESAREVVFWVVT